MKNLYFISFLFLIGCGSGAEGSAACYDCGEPTGGMGGESTGGTSSETGGDASIGGSLTGGASGSTGGTVATGGSNTCTPTVSCSDGKVASSCGPIDDGCGNTIVCGCETDSVCGGENSKRITAVQPTYSRYDYTVEGTVGVCSNTCTQQLQTIVIEDFCGIGTSDTLWACPNFYGSDIPQMLAGKNCINAPNEPNAGAFCCD